MALRVGQILKGARGVYELLYPMKGSTVFKAKVLSSSSLHADWAVVKTANTDLEKMCLKREHRNYRIPAIASSPHIRAMYDTIHSEEEHHQDEEPSCLVFEWMNQDLHSVPPPEFRSNPKLPKVVSKAVLSALDVFKTLNAVHTDISPNNIYLSDAHGVSPVAKLGDLGNLIRDGSVTQRTQCLPCRAPEVWQGHSCRHTSDVWSLGVTLTTKSSPEILFGAADKMILDHTEAWCIAKMIRLMGGPIGQPIDNETYQDEFALAEQLAIMDHPSDGTNLISRDYWRKELENIPDPPVPRDLLDFIESILVIDSEKRPTAAEALMHPYLRTEV
ncbi:SPS1 Serine threonine protein kinase [Pyrenophora tritici-repentis]|uniref:CMGC/DYRK protein kinase n=1 Tax=Pyrenophora tritici-repentis TaxID=45151 RepID=A0A2W1GSA5_9PLEO|nr:CMGC/DYRK protein kinase [Pyrenophora tritici-repentis]KAF7455164.1 CMGC/DYRK protein kinase [Pyrenophora tritici-repentis]KAF7578327.1 SPS1, Serine-threonine protein kinase [Pyrenophora tritici-repentis]KAG9388919.1 CMGC/DYRK protein kinase [Pyrenophora tritici-repentis]KAI0585823.1 CMGC/DYRK protein kinase [Pyrenophora tritici-repentis]